MGINHLQVEDILVLTEEEETSPLFVRPHSVQRFEVRKILCNFPS